MSVKKVLICDDSLLIRTQLKDFISSCDYTLDVVEAGDGQEAVELYKEHSPALVFLDVVMPKLNGIECLQAIREFDSDAKVVMLTSVGTKEIVKDALKYGAVDFMQKPWQKEILTNTIEKYIPCEVDADA